MKVPTSGKTGQKWGTLGLRFRGLLLSCKFWGIKEAASRPPWFFLSNSILAIWGDLPGKVLENILACFSMCCGKLGSFRGLTRIFPFWEAGGGGAQIHLSG